MGLQLIIGLGFDIYEPPKLKVLLIILALITIVLELLILFPFRIYYPYISQI